VLAAAGAEPEQLALGRGRVGQRLLEPDVLAGDVVGHDVDDHPDALGMRLRDQRLGAGQGAEDRVDVAEVRHVVTRVGHRRRVPGAHPDRVDAEIAQVAQARADAADVAHAVAVGIREAARIHLVDDRVAPPRCSVRISHDDLLSVILDSRYRAQKSKRSALIALWSAVF
jgi:hypothetical protein